MANLNIENLGRMVQTGDAEGLLGQNSVGSELRATREARTQGLEIPAQGELSGVTFSDVLRKSVDGVNQMQTQANTAINELVAGRNKNIHETMLTIERADDALKLMMSVRNKILDAYREIMRMQV
jgi:flagellar hook-basal body complex protein FliE